MFSYLLICFTAFIGSGLTFFSGFGLGTILLPVFALFFPLETAVALTAIVHFLNNIFKLFLVAKHVDKNILLKFGLPSVFAALLGAFLLIQLSALPALYAYSFNAHSFSVSPIKLIMSLIIIFFCLFDIIPSLSKLEFSSKYLPIGGALSGFFGGLSGNQGALRSAFLIRSGLTKEGFIATGVVIACMIDVTRLSVYASHFIKTTQTIHFPLMISATLCAFLGAFIGNKLIKKVTIQSFKYMVAFALIVFALLMGIGII